MARDSNMEAVEALVGNLESDGRVGSATTYTYALRDDFRSRYGLDRERATIACLRRRRAAEAPPELELEDQLEITEPDADELPEERYKLPELEPLEDEQPAKALPKPASGSVQAGE